MIVSFFVGKIRKFSEKKISDKTKNGFGKQIKFKKNSSEKTGVENTSQKKISNKKKMPKKEKLSSKKMPTKKDATQNQTQDFFVNKTQKQLH